MPPSEPHPADPASRRRILLCAAGLAVATLAAYHNTFAVPMVFDDIPAIADNQSIRHLWRWQDVLNPADGGNTVSGRPVLNLSLALCYAVSGPNVWAYHALNLLIHTGAALALFGVVRRTLEFHARPRRAVAGLPTHPPAQDSATFANATRHANATPVAFTIALLWALHPLQTESVTYLVQRAESLMGLFFLLTFYGFIRALDAPRPRAWQGLAVAACLLGMGTKEVMVAAPVLVLLYDRAFVAGTFRAAWERRRWLYGALAATWLPLLGLVAATGWNRGGTFSAGPTPWSYWFTQFEAVCRYLRLSFWPHPLVFDYATFTAGPADAAPYAFLVLPLLVATAVGLWRRPALGFLGAWFFAILAPTSLIPGVYQTIVEHRMYLPLAAVITLVVGVSVSHMGRRCLPVFLALAIAAGVATERRNRTYQSDLSLWTDTVAKSPDCEIAQGGLGTALLKRGRAREAREHYEIARHLNPSSAAVHYNLGLALLKLDRPAEAAACFEEAVRRRPGWAEADFQWGVALYQLNRAPEAFTCFQRVLQTNPQRPDIHFSLGLALTRMGRADEALPEYTAAARLNPTAALIQFNLGVALFQAGRVAEAAGPLQAAAQLDPAFAPAHRHLGLVLAALGRPADAIPHYEEALRLNPSFAEADCDLGVALDGVNRTAEAVGHFRRALTLQPDRAETHFLFGSALVRLGAMDEAMAQFAAAVRLEPGNASAQLNLGIALARSGRLAEALDHLGRSVSLDPIHPGAHCNLGLALAQAGRPEEALVQFQEALRLRAAYTEAHYGLGTVLVALGRLPEARSHFEAALRINPNFVPARERLEQLRAQP